MQLPVNDGLQRRTLNPPCAAERSCICLSLRESRRTLLRLINRPPRRRCYSGKWQEGKKNNRIAATEQLQIILPEMSVAGWLRGRCSLTSCTCCFSFLFDSRFCCRHCAVVTAVVIWEVITLFSRTISAVLHFGSFAAKQYRVHLKRWKTLMV